MLKYFIGIPYLMTAILTGLNLFGVTALSWWVVFLPSIIISTVMFGAVCMLIGGILFILAVLKVIQDKQSNEQQSTEDFLKSLNEQVQNLKNTTVH